MMFVRGDGVILVSDDDQRRGTMSSMSALLSPVGLSAIKIVEGAAHHCTLSQLPATPHEEGKGGYRVL